MRTRWLQMLALVCLGCGDSDKDPPPEDGQIGKGDGDAQGDGDGDPPSEGEGVGSGPESCAAVVAQYGMSCDPADYTMADCEDIRVLYVGEGCDEEWARWASCAARAAPDCEEGDFADCRDEFGGLFRCQSAFAQRTSCTRDSGNDVSCPVAAPYALLCLGAPPSKSCVMTDDDTLCCPGD